MQWWLLIALITLLQKEAESCSETALSNHKAEKQWQLLHATMSKNNRILKLSSPVDINNCSKPRSTTVASKIRKANKNYEGGFDTCDIFAVQYISIFKIWGSETW